MILEFLEDLVVITNFVTLSYISCTPKINCGESGKRSNDSRLEDGVPSRGRDEGEEEEENDADLHVQKSRH